MDFGAVQGSIRRPGRTLILEQGFRFEARVEMRPAGGEKLAELPAGEAFAASQVIESRPILCD